MPSEKTKRSNGTKVERLIQPKVDSTNSTFRTVSGSLKGLKKKKLGKVITTSQKTIKINMERIRIM
jgi:hypothetical protein